MTVLNKAYQIRCRCPAALTFVVSVCNNRYYNCTPRISSIHSTVREKGNISQLIYARVCMYMHSLRLKGVVVKQRETELAERISFGRIG